MDEYYYSPFATRRPEELVRHIGPGRGISLIVLGVVALIGFVREANEGYGFTGRGSTRQTSGNGLRKHAFERGPSTTTIVVRAHRC